MVPVLHPPKSQITPSPFGSEDRLPVSGSRGKLDPGLARAEMIPDYEGRKFLLVLDTPATLSENLTSSTMAKQAVTLLETFMALERPPHLLLLIRDRDRVDSAAKYAAELERRYPGNVTARTAPGAFRFWGQDYGKALQNRIYLGDSVGTEDQLGLARGLDEVGISYLPVGQNFEGGNILAGRVNGAGILVVGDTLARLWLDVRQIKDLSEAEKKLAPKLSRFINFEHLIISRNTTHDDLQIHVDQHLHFPGPDKAFMVERDIKRDGRQHRLASRLEQLGAEVIPLRRTPEDFFAARSITNMISLSAPEPISIIPTWPSTERIRERNRAYNFEMIQRSGRRVVELKDHTSANGGNHHCLAGMIG